MHRFSASIFLILLILFNSSPVYTTTHSDEISECVVVSHCARLDLKYDDIEYAFASAVKIIKESRRTKIIKLTDSYVRAEAKTKWMRYIDDLEVKMISNLDTLQIRSESRVGVGDMGVNKKRIETLANKLNTTIMDNNTEPS